MLGPHFYFDLIRLPRKGWSTFFRCLYLTILLVGLGVMYESRRDTIVDLASYARFAQTFAYTLLVMQDILILVLLPVYVASAIAEERENQTIEALFIAPLTNRQIVLGKFGGRMLHLGALILAGVPLLAFMHMWGNVSLSMLIYHFVNTVLMAMTAGSICMVVSIKSPVVFQAITTSYPYVFAVALVGELLAYGLPWFFDEIFGGFGGRASGVPWYFLSLAILLPAHILITLGVLKYAMTQISVLRRLETKPIRQKTGALSLSDESGGPVRTIKGLMVGSYINPLAFPIKGRALFWKECLKDGTRWSLTYGWFVIFALVVGVVCGVCQPFIATDPFGRTSYIRILTGTYGYTGYIIAMSAYFLLVIFQTTMSVAGEREQNTLEFLLLIPADRREIIFCKWLGPLWKNWPILGIAYLGVLLAGGTQVIAPMTAVTLVLLPWPFLLMCSCLSLLLSVVCRRTLYANIVIVGCLLLLLVGHIIGDQYLAGLLPAYARLVFEADYSYSNVPVDAGMRMVFIEQTGFLAIAVFCGVLAYVKFHRTDYQAKM